jgi:hypothetical protein
METPMEIILKNIPLLYEYQQKSLAIILMNLTLNDMQADGNYQAYKYIRECTKD